MKLRTIKWKRFKGKTVFLRVDFNVSIEDGKVAEDFRIKKSLDTINYLLKKKAKIVLACHLGRPEGKRVEDLSTKMLKDSIEKVLGREIKFVPACIGEEVRTAVAEMKIRDILLLDNLRFYPGEEANDSIFARELASYADIYVNDAFSVSHRAHASVEAITKVLPSYAGFLMAREVKVLHHVYEKPFKPLVLAMGGAKVATKVRMIKRFIDKVDHVLLGGVIANVVLHTKGQGVGKSKIDHEVEEELKDLDLTSPKLHLPVDLVVADNMSENADVRVVGTGAVADEEIILDIGPSTIDLFSIIAKDAKMVIWNGPFGYSEVEKFAKGTDRFAEAIAESKAYKVVGGGESITSLDKIGELKNINFVSTGGGAMLEFLAGDKMPGIEPLIKK